MGLSQSRIKRLYAYSTISHLGFILLGLSIHSLESIQAFMFYLIQYSFSNLNAFVILISIGYTYYNYNKKELHTKLDKNVLNYYTDGQSSILEKDNSPIQLISQLKGYFYINPILSLSLTITLFSFAGIPPLIGFFGKMMILSAAIDKGYIFMALIAILTSVIGAVYYLFIIREVYFNNTEYSLKEENTMDYTDVATISNGEHVYFKLNNIVLSNYLSISVSILTLLILLFIFIPNQLLNITSILVLILFNV